MNFLSFAEQHGLVIDRLVTGKWVRCSTVDHPHKMNGAYIFEGTSGAVQDWAVHEKPVPWRDRNAKPVSTEQRIRDMQRVNKEREERQHKAARKAGWIMHNAVCGHHPYLSAKGLPDEKGWVWEGKLVVPMRVNGSLVGCQLIDQDGVKKFLYGQQTKNAVAEINAKGQTWLVEGYGTGLAVRAALKRAKVRYNVVVCFSAGNMIEVAKNYPDCFVIADNDTSGTGQKAAKKIERPYWISPIEGEDAADYLQRVGADEFGLVLTAMM